MKISNLIGKAVLFATLLMAVPHGASAHCDSMDGPVVKDAQRVLTEKKVDSVLKWVRQEDEEQIRDAFELTLTVRSDSDAARSLADRYFFETLVRIHRASEGEGFMGLKPAGSTDPAIAAADQALMNGSVDELANDIAAAIRNGIEERFAEAHEMRKSADKDVEHGRDYVRAYVQFTHFVEAASHLASDGASHKHHETTEERH